MARLEGSIERPFLRIQVMLKEFMKIDRTIEEKLVLLRVLEDGGNVMVIGSKWLETLDLSLRASA
jgi:hypothetical protein